ncbi:hypothetical protein [Actinomadura kijaniata]|uniref:hypothetical protein n=1 Tax=Actinomadura kijaniata TaxID=46161 RepID=UPI0008365162|nr:hypothetical protein [Actinomadura kijaniata]
MAIARKGTRWIDVDGTAYLWKVRHRPTYSQGIGESPLTFVVERVEEPGALLVVSLPCAHPANWVGLPSATVLPSTVAEGVRTALGRGWRPGRPGPAFRVTLENAATAA